MLYCQDHIIGLRLSLSAEDIAEGSRPGDRLSLLPLESLQQVTVWARNIYCQVIDISFVRRVSHILLAWALLVPSAMAIRELVELEELQPAQQAERIILDPSDTPIPNMKGTDCKGGPQYCVQLHLTTKGTFAFLGNAERTLLSFRSRYV